MATAAWASFGFGFVELGPWWGSAPIVDSRFRVNLSQKSPAMESSVSLLPVSMMQARLRQCPSSIACLVRLMPGQAMAPTAAASELVELAHSLVDRVLGFSVDLRLASVGWGRADWDVFWRCLTTERDPIEGKACLSAENMVLVLGTSFSLREVQTACEWGIQHWMIETSRFEGGKLVLAHENTMELP